MGWGSEIVGEAVAGPNSRPVVRVRRAAWNPQSRGELAGFGGQRAVPEARRPLRRQPVVRLQEEVATDAWRRQAEKSLRRDGRRAAAAADPPNRGESAPSRRPRRVPRMGRPAAIHGTRARRRWPPRLFPSPAEAREFVARRQRFIA